MVGRGGNDVSIGIGDVETAVPSLPKTKIMVAVQCPVWHCTATFQKVKGFYGTSHYSFIVFIRLVNVVWSSSCVL